MYNKYGNRNRTIRPQTVSETIWLLFLYFDSLPTDFWMLFLSSEHFLLHKKGEERRKMRNSQPSVPSINFISISAFWLGDSGQV